MELSIQHRLRTSGVQVFLKIRHAVPAADDLPASSPAVASPVNQAAE